MNQTLPFSSLVQDDLLLMEANLRKSVNADSAELSSALDLVFTGGGKRIRPTMIFLLGRLVEAPQDELLILASAIEMLHTATLVHDDLIDHAILRRGSPTLNAHWSTGATVLTGDLLLATAARLAAQIKNFETMSLFSETLVHIVNGELKQMFDGHCKVSRPDYQTRIFAKTASMFQTGAKSVALIKNAPQEVVDALKNYGRNIGIAFQIIDDILDFTGEENTVGKPVANDLRQGLITLPAIIFIEDHPEHPDTSRLLEGNCFQDESLIDRLVYDIRASDAIDKTLCEAQKYITSAVKNLDIFPDNPYKSSLIELASYIVNRDF